MNFILSIPKNLGGFLKSVYEEIRLVEWISLRETARLTFGVILVSGGIAISLALLDRLFNVLVTNFLQI